MSGIRQVSRLFGAISGRRWDELEQLLQTLCHPEVSATQMISMTEARQVSVSVGGEEQVGVEHLKQMLKEQLGRDEFALHLLGVERKGISGVNSTVSSPQEAQMQCRSCRCCGSCGKQETTALGYCSDEGVG